MSLLTRLIQELSIGFAHSFPHEATDFSIAFCIDECLIRIGVKGFEISISVFQLTSLLRVQYCFMSFVYVRFGSNVFCYLADRARGC